MQKIYIITSGDYSEYGIEAVFTDKHEAEKYCAFYNDEVSYEKRIEEYIADKETIETERQIVYQYFGYYDFSTAKMNVLPPRIKFLKPGEKQIEDKMHFRRIVNLYERNDVKARKILQDMYMKWKAEREGI